uniref:Uncharacterized protein n=1 Tax=Oryza punctata TaxID=4537 RepID=A0A0E0MKD8_ORYPU
MGRTRAPLHLALNEENRRSTLQRSTSWGSPLMRDRLFSLQQHFDSRRHLRFFIKLAPFTSNQEGEQS